MNGSSNWTDHTDHYGPYGPHGPLQALVWGMPTCLCSSQRSKKNCTASQLYSSRLGQKSATFEDWSRGEPMPSMIQAQAGGWGGQPKEPPAPHQVRPLLAQSIQWHSPTKYLNRTVDVIFIFSPRMGTASAECSSQWPLCGQAPKRWRPWSCKIKIKSISAQMQWFLLV